MNNLNLNKYEVVVDGMPLILYDIDTSKSLDYVIPEAIYGDEYKTKDITFSPGDVVVDIGANVGSVSIMLAKKFPFIKVYSYEAHPINYKNLLKNIEANDVKNIMAFNYAVYSDDGYLLEMNLNIDNTGASNSFVNVEMYPNLYKTEHSHIEVPTISLDTIISSHDITKIKFLKIDCEGAEFEIIENSKLIYTIPIEYIAAEIHTFMGEFGKDTNQLVKILGNVSKRQPLIKLST